MILFIILFYSCLIPHITFSFFSCLLLLLSNLSTHSECILLNYPGGSAVIPSSFSPKACPFLPFIFEPFFITLPGIFSWTYLATGLFVRSFSWVLRFQFQNSPLQYHSCSTVLRFFSLFIRFYFWDSPQVQRERAFRWLQLTSKFRIPFWMPFEFEKEFSFCFRFQQKLIFFCTRVKFYLLPFSASKFPWIPEFDSDFRIFLFGIP